MRRRHLGLGLFLLSACTTEAELLKVLEPNVTPPPGDVRLGVFGFKATALELKCALPNPVDGGAALSDAPFSFNATLTADSASTQAWLTLSLAPREATWDGKVFTSQASSSRVFTGCEACRTSLQELFEVALVSQSQDAVLGGACPLEPLDGGVPRPNRDAGIAGPAMTPEGFDAVRACGRLTEVMHSEALPDAGECPAMCDGCLVRFRLDGVRQ
jgi:hypothetical protein